MPEDSKKNDKRNAKEQRKPRHRHQQGKADRKADNPEESNSAPKVPQKPPVYESPPPEFYKNLKRETDEILKITEEENAKYKKKEIQSNWSKYEVPIDSYEEIDEQENLGADYGKLIEASLSSGGHFQFKHEKSWDMNTGPSQYDKYFEINMEDLNIALCTIPFYERNNIEETLFSEAELLTMTNRSTRFKQKYFNDKSYSTPETVAQDKILSSLRDGIKTNEISKDDIQIEIKNKSEEPCSLGEKSTNLNNVANREIKEHNIFDTQNVPYTEPIQKTMVTTSSDDFVHDDFIFRNTENTKAIVEDPKPTNVALSHNNPICQTQQKDAVPLNISVDKTNVEKESNKKVPDIAISKVVQKPPVAVSPDAAKKNPVFESPEDLEKWLDDYLDG